MKHEFTFLLQNLFILENTLWICCYCKKNKLRFVYSLIVKIRAIKELNVLPCAYHYYLFMFTHVTSGCNSRKRTFGFCASVNRGSFVVRETYPYRCFDGNIFISISPMRIFYFQIGWILFLLRIEWCFAKIVDNLSKILFTSWCFGA